MRINRKTLGKFAERFVEVIDRESISSSEDLDRLLGEKQVVGQDSFDYILVELRSSNCGTKAYSVGYFVPEVGVPIDCRINRELNYSKIIAKFNGTLPSYTPFFQDEFSNIAQEILLDSSEFSKVKKEIELLSSLSNV